MDENELSKLLIQDDNIADKIIIAEFARLWNIEQAVIEYIYCSYPFSTSDKKCIGCENESLCYAIHGVPE